ncbi:SDR family oxidoreductase [Haloarcula sp. JP-L23]|nr:SDR family oxidoreductase [Haloarcula sp. JP-L23]
MANCAAFFAREDPFVTGEVLHADGGWTSDAWRYREG